MNQITKSYWKTIGITTLIVGILDLCLAFGMQWYYSGNFPSTMLKRMAGGVLGLETSLNGGTEMALVGLLLHFFISFCWTYAVFLIFPYFEFAKLRKEAMFLFGIVYTPVVNLFMHFVALPLSRLSPPKEFTMNSVGFILFSIGFTIPIFYMAWMHFRHRLFAKQN